MKASELRCGETVDITIVGARVQTVSDDLDRISVGLADGKTQASIPIWAPEVTITRRKPDEWPPVNDDVWIDKHGRPWIVNCYELTRGLGRFEYDDFWEKRGPARLAYRP